MAQYTVQAPDGRTVTLEGAEPPSESDLDQVFQSLPPAAGGGLLSDKTKRTISDLARPALETAGMMGGAALGAAAPAIAIPGLGAGASIPAASAGGALGLAGGKAAADLLDRGLGVKQPIASMPAAVKETAGDVQEGLGGEAGGLALHGALGQAPKLLSLVTGVPEEAILARYSRNEAVKAAQPISDLAQRLPDDMGKLQEQVSEMSDAALSKLPDSAAPGAGAQPKSVVLSSIQAARGELAGAISDSAERARQILDRYAQRVQGLGPTLSQRDLGGLIRDMDNDIDWSAKDLKPSNDALQGIRTQIDGALKAINPDYEQAMQPVAQGTRLLQDLKQQFSLEHVTGEGYRPTNATAANLASALRDNSVKSQTLLDGLKEATGTDYMQGLQDATTAAKFEGGRANGSRRTGLGIALGGTVGLLHGGAGAAAPGASAGALAGYITDQYGHELAGGAVDQLVKLSQLGLMPSDGLRRAIAAALAYNTEKRAPQAVGTGGQR